MPTSPKMFKCNRFCVHLAL